MTTPDTDPNIGPPAPLTSIQKKALIAAWLGWMFDGLDGYLYVMVAIPFVTTLLHKQQADSEVFSKAAIIQAAFLVGWAVGGAFFGRIGDRLGRARTLTITVLMYAVFTGMQALSTEWWHLLIFRFLAALGIGGEWAAGSALVSETLPARHRAWASALLQSGYQVGCIAAALTAGLMAGLPERYVFVIGVLPAFLTVWIRWAVPEPEEWVKADTSRVPAVAELFRGGLARITIITLALTSIALTTVWAFLYFAPDVARTLARQSGMEPTEVKQFVMKITIAYLTVNIFANFAATYLARWAGYRVSFAVFMLGSLAVFLLGWRSPPTMETLLPLTCLTAFFCLGLFGMFPLYIPPLFPTLLRTLGAGFTYNVGRLAAAAGTFYLGDFSKAVGGADGAIWWVGLLFVPGVLVSFVLPIPRGHGHRER
ncbi:MAG: MFS transporter [Phycisphaerales bacterium]